MIRSPAYLHTRIILLNTCPLHVTSPIPTALLQPRGVRLRRDLIISFNELNRKSLRSMPSYHP
jgi:hypothetical protein